jgi:hypothetical protein
VGERRGWKNLDMGSIESSHEQPHAKGMSGKINMSCIIKLAHKLSYMKGQVFIRGVKTGFKTSMVSK